MFNHKLFLFLFVLLGVLSTLSCVNAIDDLNNGCQLDDVNVSEYNNSFTKLNAIINNDSSVCEVKLDCDYIHYLDDDFPEGICINRSLIIDGQGHLINANNLSRVFNISAKNVTLKNIKFINSNIIPKSGGFISFGENSSGYISNSIFINGTSRHGGAIFFNSGSLGVIDNSTFINSFALYGAAVYFDVNSISLVKDCVFYNNSACDSLQLGDGGAICYGPYVNCTILNSNFTKNSATVCGGAINCGDYNNIIINNSMFIDNCVNRFGGAIQLSDHVNSSIFNLTFINNKAKSGGAIYYSWRDNYISNSSFINNTALDDGGAIYFYKNSRTIVNNSNFSFNVAKYGGGIYYRDKYKGIIDCSVFMENVAVCGGGIFYLNESSKSVVNNSLFVRNYALNSSAVYGGILDNCTIVKILPNLTLYGLSCRYNDDNYLVVVLKGFNNSFIENALIDIEVNGFLNTLRSNSKGEVSLSTKGLLPGRYGVIVYFNGDDNFYSSSFISNIVVKKVSIKINAKSKSFKSKIKNKKYTVILRVITI